MLLGRSSRDRHLGIPTRPAPPAFEPEAGSSSITTLFSGARNDASFSGMCLKVGSVPLTYALSMPPGCPIPCNPTWGSRVDRSRVRLECILLPNGRGRGLRLRTRPRPRRRGLLATDSRARHRRVRARSRASWSGDHQATPRDPGFHGCETFVAGLTNEGARRPRTSPPKRYSCPACGASASPINEASASAAPAWPAARSRSRATATLASDATTPRDERARG